MHTDGSSDGMAQEAACRTLNSPHGLINNVQNKGTELITKTMGKFVLWPVILSGIFIIFCFYFQIQNKFHYSLITSVCSAVLQRLTSRNGSRKK